MKAVYKIMIVGCLLLGFSFSGWAQERNMTPKDRAEKLTLRMKTELELTSQQVQQVSEINENMFERRAEIREKAEGNKEMAQSMLKELSEENSKEMRKVLSDNQFARYEEMKKKRKEMQKRKMANRKRAEQSK